MGRCSLRARHSSGRYSSHQWGRIGKDWGAESQPEGHIVLGRSPGPDVEGLAYQLTTWSITRRSHAQTLVRTHRGKINKGPERWESCVQEGCSVSRGAGLSALSRKLTVQSVNATRKFSALNLMHFYFYFRHKNVRIWIFMQNTLIWLNSRSWGRKESDMTERLN